MGQVLARLGGQGRALEFRVFDCYARVVGDLLRARTAPERIAGTTLFVRVATSALAHEVTLLRGEIIAKLTAELGAGDRHRAAHARRQDRAPLGSVSFALERSAASPRGASAGGAGPCQGPELDQSPSCAPASAEIEPGGRP